MHLHVPCMKTCASDLVKRERERKKTTYFQLPNVGVEIKETEQKVGHMMKRLTSRKPERHTAREREVRKKQQQL